MDNTCVMCMVVYICVGPAPWDVEADIAALFSKHSVKDVRKIEQKTRLDIERKKEELRQMVGYVTFQSFSCPLSPPCSPLSHSLSSLISPLSLIPPVPFLCSERYRDLIDAADSIMGLRTGSEQVCY